MGLAGGYREGRECCRPVALVRAAENVYLEINQFGSGGEVACLGGILWCW